MAKKQIAADVKPKVSFADDKKYTVADIAEMLGKSTKTVYGWIRARKLRAYRFGKDFIITASHLNDFAENQFLDNWYFTMSNPDALDPAFVPPVEVDIDTLSEAQILSAYVIVSELGLKTENIETSQKREVDEPVDELYDASALHSYLKKRP
jgi:excisionase family DNA binding protein